MLYRDRIGHGDISEKVIRLEVPQHLFQQVSMRLQLCRSRVQVWDWRDGVVHLVGQTSVAFHVLITQGFEAPLINPKRKMVDWLLWGGS